MSSNTTDMFDYTLINNDLITLQTAYEEFYKAMQRIDAQINTSLQIPDGGALYGDKGKEFLAEWNTKCAGFKNYYYLFKSWTNKVIEVGKEFGVVASTVFGENAKTISFEPIKETVTEINITDARLLSALLLGLDEIDGQKIKTIKEAEQEFAIVGDNKYLITCDDEGRITKVTIDGETKTVRRTVEERINKQYNAYKSGEMSQEEWNEYVEGLDEESQTYIKYLETGADLYKSSDIESLLKDYASSDLALTGVGSLVIYPGDVAISSEGMPYEFMGLSMYDMGGYYDRTPEPIYRSLNDGNAEYYTSYDGWKQSDAYTYINGEFVKIEGKVGNYVGDEFNQGFTSQTFDDGTGPVKVIRGGAEIPEGAYLVMHQFGTPEEGDSRVVVAQGEDFFSNMWETAKDDNGWTQLPKIIYVPGDKTVRIDSGLPFGVFSTNIKPENGEGFYMIRDDNSYSYWRLEESGVYYEFNGNDGRIPIGSLSSTSLK